jgi:hypothetical protein
VLLAERVYYEDGPGLRVELTWQNEAVDVHRVGRRLALSFTDKSTAWLPVRTSPATWFEPGTTNSSAQ